MEAVTPSAVSVDLSLLEEYAASLLEQGEQVSGQITLLQYTLAVIVCFLVIGALVFVFKAFYRFIGSFF